jgi:hypothetical protein
VTSGGKLTVLVATLALFLVLCAVIAAHPWTGGAATAASSASQDPRLARLAAREERLRKEAAAVKRLVRRRWAVYERKLARRKSDLASARRAAAQAPAAPSVQIVTVPAVTSTRTS